METIEIWNNYHQEYYFFILKRLKYKHVADEVLQNSFLKIHQNLESLKDISRVKAWGFQIVRNEISNFNALETGKNENAPLKEFSDDTPNIQYFCCFKRFVSHLPENYKEVIELVYFSGKKQQEAAKILGISLPNLKAIIRRSKKILKKNFHECCKYEFNSLGQLVGEGDCAICN